MKVKLEEPASGCTDWHNLSGGQCDNIFYIRLGHRKSQQTVTLSLTKRTSRIKLRITWCLNQQRTEDAKKLNSRKDKPLPLLRDKGQRLLSSLQSNGKRSKFIQDRGKERTTRGLVATCALVRWIRTPGTLVTEQICNCPLGPSCGYVSSTPNLGRGPELHNVPRGSHGLQPGSGWARVEEWKQGPLKHMGLTDCASVAHCRMEAGQQGETPPKVQKARVWAGGLRELPRDAPKLASGPGSREPRNFPVLRAQNLFKGSTWNKW